MNSSPVATLSAALLVTKGNAQPSRGLAQPMTDRIGLAMRVATALGTNETIPTEPVPVTWPVSQAFVPQLAPPRAAAAASRITIKVDDTQRLRLRLASAHLGKSRQVILIDALDHYLKRVMPSFLHEPCPCMQGEAASGSDCCQHNESQ
jgi:hypothetical protein